MKNSLKRTCLHHLRETFGLEYYRPGQKAAVHALLSGRDVMCILPTGAGKSLCWQLPALVHNGLTVVVSPLIALMRDQVAHLSALGIAAVSLDSLMDREERDACMAHIRSGEVRIVYVSPERLEHRVFRQLCCEVKPWLLVVDEAHCVVQWGEGFRPAYAGIAEFVQMLPVRPVICALTATADRKIQRGIHTSLGMRREKRILLPILRENLVYEVRTTLDRTGCIVRLLTEQPCKTVIFCRSRNRTEHLAGLLVEKGFRAEFYHAGLDRERRLAVQTSFCNGKIDVLLATTAFGMGVDIPDIRRIIHDDLTESLIDYVQQSGRAGRDGGDAACILYLEPRQLVQRANVRKNAREKYPWRPVRQWRYTWKERRKLRGLLTVLLASECIAAAIVRAFGRKWCRCGRCSACANGALLAAVPDFGAMKEWQVRAFILRWQRDAMAKLKKCPTQEVMSDAALTYAAKKLVFPAEVYAPAEMERLLRHLRHEKMHDSDAEWIF